MLRSPLVLAALSCALAAACDRGPATLGIRATFGSSEHGLSDLAQFEVCVQADGAGRLVCKTFDYDPAKHDGTIDGVPAGTSRYVTFQGWGTDKSKGATWCAVSERFDLASGQRKDDLNLFVSHCAGFTTLPAPSDPTDKSRQRLTGRRAFPTCVTLSTGEVLVAGGFDKLDSVNPGQLNATVANADVWDFRLGRFREKPITLLHARGLRAGAASSATGSEALLTGGSVGAKYKGDGSDVPVVTTDPGLDKGERVTALREVSGGGQSAEVKMTVARVVHSMVAAGGGVYAIAGAVGPAFDVGSALDNPPHAIYEVSQNGLDFAAVSNIAAAQPRHGHASVAVDMGGGSTRVVTVGGIADAAKWVEVYEPGQAASLPGWANPVPGPGAGLPIFFPMIAALPNGRVVATGGVTLADYDDGDGKLKFLPRNAIRLLDLAQSKFTKLGPSRPRVLGVAVPLDVSHVLLAGGLGYDSAASKVVPDLGPAEILDVNETNPLKQTAPPASPLSAAQKVQDQTLGRVGACAAQAPNGLVLIAGGVNPATGEPVDSAEVYNPMTTSIGDLK